MKKFAGVIMLAVVAQLSYSQTNLRKNKFNLPVLENEIAFYKIDSIPHLSKADFYAFSKDWLCRTFVDTKIELDSSSLNKDSISFNKGTNILVEDISFKISDQNIKAPLNYTAKVTMQFINGVASIKLHELKYTSAETGSKYPVSVTYEVTQQMLAKTDELYPNTWNSLKNYVNDFMENYINYINDKIMQRL